MKKIFKTILFLISLLSFSNIYANTGDLENTNTETESGFTISSINVIDDRNLEIIFSNDLAREELNLKIYDSTDKEIALNSVTIGTGNTKDGTESRKEVYVFTSSKLNTNTKYYVLITNARSMDGEVIKQEKKDILIDNQSFNTEEKLEKSVATEIKNDIIENPNTIKELKSASDEKVIETAKIIEKEKNNSNKKEINPINDVSKLPKTGPGEFLIFVLLSLLFTASFFYFRKSKQI